MVWTTVNEGIDTLTNWTGLMAGDKKDSTDNPYLDWLNDMRVTFYEAADYGTDWAAGGGGVDVATTFPGSPSNGVSFLRKNTNGASGQTRLYIYEGTWIYETIGAPTEEIDLDDLTDVVITSVGDLELLQYDNATSKWINQTFAEVAYPFDDIGPPNADVNFNFGVNHFHLTFTSPTTEAGVILELLGNTSGRDLLHLHQTTGNPTGETRLIHLEWSDAEVVPMRWMSETSAFFLYFDMETLTVADKTVTFPNATGVIALTNEAQWLLIANIDDTPVDSELNAPISSNWAYDHQNNPTNIKHLTDAQLSALHPIYSHPSHPGDDGAIDTGLLSGATIISDLDLNVTTDLEGHVTDANMAVATRELTPADIGAATTANDIAGTYTIWLGTYSPDIGFNTTNADNSAAQWGGGSALYVFGSGTSGTYVVDLHKILPQDLAGKRVTISTVRAYFWRTSGSSTISLDKQQVSRSGANDAATNIDSSSTMVFVRSNNYYAQAIGESIENDHYYYITVSGVPTSATPRLLGFRVVYTITA